MKNQILTFSLALAVVLAAATVRRSVGAVGGSPVPVPPNLTSVGGSPVPVPPNAVPSDETR